MGKKVLITGIGGPAGRSAAVYFGQKGFFTAGTDVREVDTCVDDFRFLPMAADEAYGGALLGLVRDIRPVLLVPTVTEELLKAARLKNDIEALGTFVFISPPEAVEIANDKYKTYLFMKENGIPVPRTFEGGAPKETVIRDLGLPLLTKPCFGRGGRGVRLYNTAAEVMGEDREGIIFQEFIPGEEFDVNLFARGGEALASVALKKTEMKEGVVGNALRVERVGRVDASDLCKKAARLLRMEGPLDFDVRLRRDGTPALLEINARLGGNSLSATEVLDCFLDMV